MYVNLCIDARGCALNNHLDNSNFSTAASGRIHTLSFFCSRIGMFDSYTRFERCILTCFAHHSSSTAMILRITGRPQG